MTDLTGGGEEQGYALPSLAFTGVTLVGMASSGRANVPGIELAVGPPGITVTANDDTPPRTLAWQGVQGLRIQPDSSLPDGKPATQIDVALHGRTVRFLAPSEQLTTTEIDGLRRWAATRPFSAFSTSDDLDAAPVDQPTSGTARMKKELNTPFLRIVGIIVVVVIIALVLYFFVFKRSSSSLAPPAPAPVAAVPPAPPAPPAPPSAPAAPAAVSGVPVPAAGTVGLPSVTTSSTTSGVSLVYASPWSP